MNVHFVVTMNGKDMQKAEQQGLLEFFKLTGKINTSNMMCFGLDADFFCSVLGLYASLRIFKVALNGVLRSPVSFFDTTPMGKVSMTSILAREKIR